MIDLKQTKKSNSKEWSPYLAGALVGLLAIASVYLTTVFMGKSVFLGASTTFVRAAGLAAQFADPAYVEQNVYYTKEKVLIDWQFLMVIGIFFGALLSSKTDGSFKLENVPPLWKERFGSSIPKRAVFSFLGGIVAMIGARLADGCPSGHGLSGMMQLSESSFIALAMFFGIGVITANLMYQKRSK